MQQLYEFKNERYTTGTIRTSNITRHRLCKTIEVDCVSQRVRPLDTDPEIFLVGGKDDADFPRLLDAARKAVALGYRVYMLPNPHGFRTADFIFERKGVYRMYDLKTVHGKSSVDTQLLDSIGQANRILLNMTSDYNPRTLAKDIRRYFERNANADDSGSCGENVTYTFNEATGTLVISGTGAMTDYAYNDGSINTPWYSYRESIQNVDIKTGITSIGNYAFIYCSNLTNITIPSSVTCIGFTAFWDCKSSLLNHRGLEQ